MEDKRSAERVQVSLDARWEGVLAQCAGTVVDLSTTGCFILTSDLVAAEELIRLEVELPTGGVMYLWGQVVYKVSEMGFGIRFTGVSDAERQLLELLIDYARGNHESIAA
jgi:hypothetical protein